MRLLGPVEVLVDGVVLPVPGLRRRAVLAVLGLHARRPVSTDRLIAWVWDDAAPATAVNTLQRHISHLRDILGSRDLIVARAPGYLLGLGPDDTDVAVAERLIREAGAAADPAVGPKACGRRWACGEGVR